MDRFNVLVSFTSTNGYNIWSINGKRQGIKPHLRVATILFRTTVIFSIRKRFKLLYDKKHLDYYESCDWIKYENIYMTQRHSKK